MYIVSACLLGANCKYNGGNNDNEAVKDFCEGHKVLVVCPETAGGLKAPRPPAEQVKVSSAEEKQVKASETDADPDAIRIIDRDGRDVTEYFLRGAEICMKKVCAACKMPDNDTGSEITGPGSKDSTDGENAHDVRSEDPEIPELAILKANSPSCGSGCIYDGTFTGTLTDGDGVFARMLKDRGIKVITENDISSFAMNTK
ncbi:MAG: DUF523 domain-containing protein [Eubacterium sp.]|nr:DUF523 domain-containing protein [Eubacterium sp.]